MNYFYVFYVSLLKFLIQIQDCVTQVHFRRLSLLCVIVPHFPAEDCSNYFKFTGIEVNKLCCRLLCLGQYVCDIARACGNNSTNELKIKCIDLMTIEQANKYINI